MEVILFICSGSAACGPCIHAIGSNRLPVEIVRLDTREARSFLTGRSGLTITHVPSLVVIKPDGMASTFVGTQSVMKWLSSMFAAPVPREYGEAPQTSTPLPTATFTSSLRSLGSFGPRTEEIPLEEDHPKKQLTFAMASDKKTKPKAKSKKSSSTRIGVGRPTAKGRRKTKKAEPIEEASEGEGESIALEIVEDEEEPASPTPKGYVDARYAKGMAIAPHPGRSNKDLKAMAAALQQERTSFLKSRHSRWGVRDDVEA